MPQQVAFFFRMGQGENVKKHLDIPLLNRVIPGKHPAACQTQPRKLNPVKTSVAKKVMELKEECCIKTEQG